VGRNAAIALGIFVALWLVRGMLLGNGYSGVFLSSTPITHADGSPSRPGELPSCVSVRVLDTRSWPGLETIHSEVSLTGCNNSAGELRLTSGPTCKATSFLGPGTASCTATQSGRDLKVVFSANYPVGIGFFAVEPTTTTFRLTPEGSYFSA
jgi:hypothetical protein